MNLVITPERDGLTIKTVLFRELGFSVGMVKRLKALDDGIMLNGERVTVRTTVHEGDTLSLHTEDTEDEVNRTYAALDLPIDILYEDDDVVVVGKPSGMPTIPTHGHRDDTLANALMYRYRNAPTPFVFRPVNRLDRETSGVVLAARSRLAAKICSAELHDGGFEKRYTAVVRGVPTKRNGRIIGYIKRKAPSIILRELCDEGTEGEYSETLYRVTADDGKNAVVELTPITGKTHQLRVHLAHIGHPILGDTLYGEPSELIDRTALHAHTLSFTLPAGRRICIKAPIPQDMQLVMDGITAQKG